MKPDAQKLSLGAIPKPDTVKIALTLSAELKAQLDVYAEMHSNVYGVPVDAAGLIPYMLKAFVSRDRAFKTLTRDMRASAKFKNSGVLGLAPSPSRLDQGT